MRSGPASETAQATELVLQAIARSDGTRASVLEQIQATRIEDGILGTFRFDRNGDITPGWVTIVRITKPVDGIAAMFDGAAVERVIRLPTSVLDSTGAVVEAPPAPTVLVRRGPRPGGLAPPGDRHAVRLVLDVLTTASGAAEARSATRPSTPAAPIPTSFQSSPSAAGVAGGVAGTRTTVTSGALKVPRPSEASRASGERRSW